MKSIRRMLVTTAAIGGLMALTTTTNAVGPGYGPDSPSRESIREMREGRETTGGDYGSATGGETDTGSGCSHRRASGSGTGGSMDTGTGGATGTGTGGTTDPVYVAPDPGDGG